MPNQSPQMSPPAAWASKSIPGARPSARRDAVRVPWASCRVGSVASATPGCGRGDPPTSHLIGKAVQSPMRHQRASVESTPGSDPDAPRAWRSRAASVRPNRPQSIGGARPGSQRPDTRHVERMSGLNHSLQMRHQWRGRRSPSRQHGRACAARDSHRRVSVLRLAARRSRGKAAGAA